MKSNQEVKCDSCPVEQSYKLMKRMNGSWRCLSCYSKKRKEHREYLKRDVLHIRKRSDLVKEYEARRKLREAILKSKPKEITGKRHKLSFYFTKNEKQFLFKKYKLSGMDYNESQEKYNNDISYLTNLIHELRKQKMPQQNINLRFQEAFSQLLTQNENTNRY